MTILISISISIFFKSVDISTINIRYLYIEQGYPVMIDVFPTGIFLHRKSVMLIVRAASPDKVAPPSGSLLKNLSSELTTS